MTLIAGLGFLWIGFGVTAAVIAAAYGRDFFLWLTLGLLCGVFALVLVIALPKPAATAAIPSAAGGAGDKQCPKCSGWTIEWARKCKHCGHQFADSGSKAA
jgi:hypothetical protein